MSNRNSNSTELRKYTCVICGKVCKGFGNNPFPIKNSGECCNTCNAIKVIPERISLYSKEKGLDTSKDIMIMVLNLKQDSKFYTMKIFMKLQKFQ